MVARENAKLKAQNVHREKKVKVTEILEVEKKEFESIQKKIDKDWNKKMKYLEQMQKRLETVDTLTNEYD